MRIIGILGDIGSGKSYLAENLGYPVFNADKEVINIYNKDKNCFKKLKQEFPNYINSFPINKKDIIKIISFDKNSIIKLGKLVHPYVNKRLKKFLKKNKNKKAKYVVLDIPLLMENNITNEKMILIFLQTKKNEVMERLKKRPNFSNKIYDIVKKNQLPLSLKRKKSRFILKNNFKKATIEKFVKKIKQELSND